MIEILLIIAIVALLAAIFWIDAGAKDRRRNAIWETVAQDLGLEYRLNPPLKSPQLSGVLDGVSVEAKATFSSALSTILSNSNNHFTYAEVAVQLTGALPRGMRIHRKHLLKRAGDILSGKAIEIGDNALDAQFIFYGESPQEVRDLVRTRAVKQALLSAQKCCESMHIEDEMIHFKKRGADRDEESITSPLHSGVALATALKNAVRTQQDLGAASANKPPSSPLVPPTQQKDHSNHW